MPFYFVTWEQDGVEAASPLDAARICRALLLDPTNKASVFLVEPIAGHGGESVEVDALSEEL